MSLDTVHHYHLRYWLSFLSEALVGTPLILSTPHPSIESPNSLAPASTL